jgi:hypothetical protein
MAAPGNDPIQLSALIDHLTNRMPNGDALQRLSAAVETSVHLNEVADHLIGHFVDQARRDGASWTEIGQHMGVTKQAAQKRFVPKQSEDLDFPRGGRLSRFTKRAHNVLAAAKLQAQDLGHPDVTPGHLVLALISEPDGLAARAIVHLGVPLDQLRATLVKQLGGQRRTSRRSRTGFSRETKKAIELALREALHLGHNYIGTEHLLLGVLRSDNEATARQLVSLGVSHAAAETWIRAELASLQAAGQLA